MKSFNLNRNSAQLALLQRIELADNSLKRIRKNIWEISLFKGVLKVSYKYYKNFRKLLKDYE